LPFEAVAVPLYDAAWEARRAEADLAASGGQVPVLHDGETAVWNSLGIIGYLDRITGGERFWPVDRRRMRGRRAWRPRCNPGWGRCGRHAR
jgi:glutathione S-transferase